MNGHTLCTEAALPRQRRRPSRRIDRLPCVGQLRAFIIMPFDPEFDAVYSDLIVAPLSAAGFAVKRADDVEARQNVLVDVVRGIAEADLIIADLTSLNPNVFYELGLAHAMGVPTVLIAQRDSADDIPFDLRQYRTEFYDTHFQRAKAIVGVLEKLGQAHAAGTLRFGSPVSDFLPGAAKPTTYAQRTGAVGARSREPVSEAPDRTNAETTGDEEAERTPELIDERGLLDYIESLSNGSDELETVSDTIVAATVEVGADIEALTDRINNLDVDSPTAATQGKKLLLHAAQILDRYANVLEAKQAEFEAAVDSITSSGLGYFTLLADVPEQFAEELASAKTVSNELRKTVEEATTAMSGMRDSIATLPPLLKQTNRARNRTVRALDALLAQFDRVRSYAEQAIGLAQDGLEKLSADPATQEPGG